MKYFWPMLAVLFVGLKLTGYIDWSWWWGTSPLWGGFGALLAVAVLTFPFCLISAWFKGGKQ